MSSVRYYFDKWNRDGTFIKINDTLRKLARHALDLDPEPSISVEALADLLAGVAPPLKSAQL
jgi:transposase, IS4 family